jgi:hypothetical protein
MTRRRRGRDNPMKGHGFSRAVKQPALDGFSRGGLAHDPFENWLAGLVCLFLKHCPVLLEIVGLKVFTFRVTTPACNTIGRDSQARYRC